jgi:hypothetical protein
MSRRKKAETVSSRRIDTLMVPLFKNSGSIEFSGQTLKFCFSSEQPQGQAERDLLDEESEAEANAARVLSHATNHHADHCGVPQEKVRYKHMPPIISRRAVS